ncbi:MAG: hypothetical protein NUW24_06040 [Anaerolineae bacterium]|jgi:regulator of replication initiation timing|nr:hypothetical protein [Anaerolineae bacterium]MDH7473902.1 hypothetical protein [Anaerolineae bacterium]
MTLEMTPGAPDKILKTIDRIVQELSDLRRQIEGRTVVTENVAEDLEHSQALYRRFKERLRQRYPSLQDLPRAQALEVLERLSEKIAEGMPFATWQEADSNPSIDP